MTPRPGRSAVLYPELLRTHIGHARRFAEALRGVAERAANDEAASIWLEGRPEEVAIFVGDVLRAWKHDEISTSAAALAIESYLDTLHRTLAGWFGEWYAPSCCGPLAEAPASGHRRRERLGSGARPAWCISLSDTTSEAPAVLDSGAGSTAGGWAEIGGVR